jgi:hypothetical protein
MMEQLSAKPSSGELRIQADPTKTYATFVSRFLIHKKERRIPNLTKSGAFVRVSKEKMVIVDGGSLVPVR